MRNGYIELINYILSKETEGIDIICLLIMISFEAVMIFIPGLILHFRKGIFIKRIFHFFLIAAYFAVIIMFTILRREPGSTVGEIHLNINLGFGLKGYGISKWNSSMSILNILLFVPWGILIYSFLRRKGIFSRIIRTSIIGMLTSIFVECNQLLSATGRFEITDIVTNTAGTFFGAAFLAIVISLMNKKHER